MVHCCPPVDTHGTNTQICHWSKGVEITVIKVLVMWVILRILHITGLFSACYIMLQPITVWMWLILFSFDIQIFDISIYKIIFPTITASCFLFLLYMNQTEVATAVGEHMNLSIRSACPQLLWGSVSPCPVWMKECLSGRLMSWADRPATDVTTWRGNWPTRSVLLFWPRHQ